MLRNFPRRAFSTELFSGILTGGKPNVTALSPPPAAAADVVAEDGEGLNQMLAHASTSDMDELLGPRRIRSTVVESAVRMIADYFMVYDAMDKVLLDQEFKLEYGSTGLEGEEESDQDALVSINQNLLNSLDKPSLQRVHNNFFQDYIPTKLGSANFYNNYTQFSTAAPYYSQPGSGEAYKSLLYYMKNLRPEFLSGLSKQLMETKGVPDLDVFHLVIRQLTLYRYSKPAQMALQCLLQSGISLNAETLSIALKLATSNGDVEHFRQLSRIFDLREPPGLIDTNPLFQNMSQTTPGKWDFQRKEMDNLLRARFFPNSGPKMNKKQMAYLYTTLVEGFYKLNWHNYIDMAIRKMIRQGIPLNVTLLTVNFKVAKKTSDPVRARWTWDRLVELHNSDPAQVDSKAYNMAKLTAQTINDQRLLDQIASFSFSKSPPLSSRKRSPHVVLSNNRQKAPPLKKIKNLERDLVIP